MGSMSGSVVTNVLTTGQLTIPAMRNLVWPGKSPAALRPVHLRAGVVAADNGVHGFRHGDPAGHRYIDVAAAAALPAFLYFASLYLQIDAYAGREKVVGLAEEDIPSLGKTIAEGGSI